MPVRWQDGCHEAGRGALQYVSDHPYGWLGLARGGQLAVAVAILAESCGLSKKISHVRQVALVRSALLAASGEGGVEEATFLAQLQRVQAEYLSAPERAFVLLTALSLPHHEELGRVRLRDASVRFRGRPPQGFDRPDLVGELRGRRRCPPGYTAVLVRVSSRSLMAAGETALERLDFIRGLWSYHWSRRHRDWSLPQGPNPDPLGLFRLGPLHTLHEPDGPLAMDQHWYEPKYHYVEKATPSLEAEEARLLRENDRTIRRRIGRMSMKEDVETLFVRYARALDTPDYDSAVLRLWSLLELVTGSGQRDDVARRAAFLMRDPSYHQLQLKQLREARNQFVHEGSEPADAVAFAQSLRGYVNAAVSGLLEVGSSFRSLREWGAFLDLPAARGDLEKRRDLYKRALDFRYP